MSHQREVFPGLDSGPNCSEGHYFYTLEKRPSGDSLYTTGVDMFESNCKMDDNMLRAVLRVLYEEPLSYSIDK